MTMNAAISPATLSSGRRAQRQVVPFRIRHLDGFHVLTNDLGDHLLLNDEQLQRMLSGKVAEGDPLWQRMLDQNFVADKLDRKALVERQKEKLKFLAYGPNLHIMVITLRCDHTCQYCHASRAPMSAHHTDMSIETAERSVDFAFESTSPGLTIEFQGGEPLANWPVLEHIIEYSLQKNALAGKSLTFALVTNLSLMDDEKLDYLIERRVQICTSLDGPEEVHNYNRVFKEGNAHDQVVRWMKIINKRYTDAGLDPKLYRIEALPTISRPMLADPKGLLDHYVDVGCHSIFLRNLDPHGFAATTRKRIGYSMEEWLVFYEEALDYVIELNRKGVDFIERTAALFLARILAHHEPNFLDIRNPCGAAIGQIAYNYDGRMFTCDEGRMVDASGDSCFAIGNVAEDGYQEVISSPIVRAMTIASTLQGQPGCSTCAYLPWCGICPVHNYAEQGSIQGRMADSHWCQKHMGIMDLLMRKLQRADEFEMQVFERWTQVREQPHFLHECAEI